MSTLTVLISTHNRAELLERTLKYLNGAECPRDCPVEILVVANACSDATHRLLERYEGQLPLDWTIEPKPGKSHALNRALPLVKSDLVAFVDDDHRVDRRYLVAACSASEAYPDADLICGRILPDWDGSEPSWVHDDGPYRIYPLPVPRYDLGGAPLASPQNQAAPGGGNWVLRTRLFARVGPFSPEYGPVGRGLGGGEDMEWVGRAIACGARLQYVPDIVQYHYADPERLTLGYLVRKAFERSAGAVRLAGATAERGLVPGYMLRKAGSYFAAALLSLGVRRRRFYLVRLAAALGEMKGHLLARRERHAQNRRAYQ